MDKPDKKQKFQILPGADFENKHNTWIVESDNGNRTKQRVACWPDPKDGANNEPRDGDLKVILKNGN